MEAKTNPALDSNGYFLFGVNDGYYGPSIIFELPDTASTSWVHSYPDLPPGHCYDHVGGFDSSCSTCPIREWSTLGTFAVNPPPPPPNLPKRSSRRPVWGGGISSRGRSKGFLQFTRMRVMPPRSLPRFKPFTQKLSCNYR